MRIAVVGATGPTGQLAVAEALGRGHEVVAYVRRPQAMTAVPRLSVVPGELADIDAFASAIAGCDVVVCTLGNRSFKIRNFMREHLPMVSAAMLRSGVNRLVLMSALGGGELPTKVTGVGRGIFKFLSRTVFVDRTESESELAATGVAWCGVYPGFLTDGPAVSKVDVVDLNDLLDVRGGGQIPRANVASLLVDLAEDDQSPGRRLAIAPPGTLRW